MTAEGNLVANCGSVDGEYETYSSVGTGSVCRMDRVSDRVKGDDGDSPVLHRVPRKAAAMTAADAPESESPPSKGWGVVFGDVGAGRTTGGLLLEGRGAAAAMAAIASAMEAPMS